MPLVVPILRFFVVFLNVYETFKTLKPPPPSTRRGGQPSARAISQRKRDLKGCLAVWAVWCCYAVYERTFDRVVGIFLPFYSEIKSVFLLFLVLTRAKGAEPLFLHVLRPLVKPYVTVVDPLLGLSRDIGDFFFAVLQVPLDYILSSPWFSFWGTGNLEEESSELSPNTCSCPVDSMNSTRTGSQSSIPVLVDHRAGTSRIQNERYSSTRSVSDNQRLSCVNNPASYVSRDRHLKSASTTSLPAYSEHPFHDPPRYSRTLSKHNGHQIWYPSASAHPPSGQEVSMSTLDSVGTSPEYHSPEWRTYPAFPSAYPPTPLPATPSLPSSATANLANEYRLASDPAYPPIPENEQDFYETLETQHEGHPDLVVSSSNGNRILGVNSYQEHPQQLEENTSFDDSMYSSETGFSEDDLGASLRTPLHSPGVIHSGPYSSVDSTDNASSLRTKTSSDSLSSGASPLAGHKRTHGTFQGRTRNTLPASYSRSATLRGKPAPPFIPQDFRQSSTSEDEAGSDNSSTKAKRQKVLDPVKRKSTVRPAPKGTGSGRKVPLPSRSLTARGRVATVSQATSRIRAGPDTTSTNSTLKGRKSTLAPRQFTRDSLQGIVKSSSTSSSQSGTLRGRV